MTDSGLEVESLVETNWERLVRNDLIHVSISGRNLSLKVSNLKRIVGNLIKSFRKIKRNGTSLHVLLSRLVCKP